jgi:hypothetical protein
MATFGYSLFLSTYVYPIKIMEGLIDENALDRSQLAKWETLVYRTEVKRTAKPGILNVYKVETTFHEPELRSALVPTGLLDERERGVECEGNRTCQELKAREWSNTGLYVDFMGKLALKCNMKPLGTEIDEQGTFSSVKWLSRHVESFFQCCVSISYQRLAL